MKAISAFAVLLTGATALAGATDTIERPGVAILRPPAARTPSRAVTTLSRAQSATNAADPRVFVSGILDVVDGDPLRYELQASNDGDVDLPGPIVVDLEFSDAFASAFVTGNGWMCSMATATCVWPDTLAAGDSTTIAQIDTVAARPYGDSTACDPERSPCLQMHATVRGYPDSIGSQWTAVTINGHAPPTALDDLAYMPASPVPIVIQVQANDISPWSRQWTMEIVENPTDGTATVDLDGSVRYTPGPAFAGTDRFRYRITDADGGTDTGTVTIGPLTGGIAFQLPLIDIGQVEVGRVAMRVGWIDNTTGALLVGTANVEPVDPADIPALLAGTGYDPAMAVFDPTVLKPQDGQFVQIYTTFPLVDAIVKPHGPVGTVYIARVRLAVSPYLNPQVTVTAETVIVARADDGTHTPVHARDDAQFLSPDAPTVVFPLSNDGGTQGGTLTVSALGIQEPFDGTITFDLGTLEFTETNFPFTGIRVIPFPGATGTGTFTYATSELVGGTYDRHDFASFTVTLGTPPPPPIAVASGSASICAGGSTGLSGSGGATCSWSPAAGLDFPTSCTPSASPASTTTYTLTVYDAGGQASTNNPTVTVTVDPLPIAVAAGSATINPGQSAPLNGSGGVSCAWSPALGLNNPASCTPIASPAVTTTYALVVTSGAGCPSVNPASATITVVPAGGAPDLVVSSLMVPPNAPLGGPITVAFAIANAGTSAAGASTTGFYLSVDAVLDAGDIRLAGSAVNPLAPGQTAAGLISLALPAGVSGKRWIIAAADDLGAVAESIETNNTGSGKFNIKQH
jgi:hypothetical protein